MGTKSKKNIFSRAWKAIKGKRGSREASSSGTGRPNARSYRDAATSPVNRSYRDAATSPASSLSGGTGGPNVRSYRDAATSPASSLAESRQRSSSTSRKSSKKSSPVESRRRSSSSSQNDGNFYNSGEYDPWRASYRHGALAYPGDYDQDRVRSYPRPPQQEYDYSYISRSGRYYSRGIDNVNGFVRDDAAVASWPPPHTSYGYHRPSESNPDNCAVM